MKAFLLAAGEGTRLRPLTFSIPKCLVPIKRRPLLDYWLSLCERYGIKEVLINLHHLPHLIEQFLENNSYNLKIQTFYEEKLLGSAGTIKANYNFIKNTESFFIFYGDNFTDIDIKKFWDFHHAHQGIVTMALFKTNVPEECGIVEMGTSNLITSFEEKPQNPYSNLANAGLFVASPQILDYIPDQKVADLGFDVLPKLVGKMYGYVMEEYLIDIGTWENYRRVQEEFFQL